MIEMLDGCDEFRKVFSTMKLFWRMWFDIKLEKFVFVYSLSWVDAELIDDIVGEHGYVDMDWLKALAL